LKLSVRSNIIIIFLTTTAIIVTALLSSQYYFSQKTANETTEKTFALIATNIRQKIDHIQQQVQKNIYANINNPALYSDINFNPNHPVLQNFIYMCNADNSISAIYFTNNTKAFYELINMKDNTVLHEKIQAPKETRWTVVIYKESLTQYTFFDKKLKPLKKLLIKGDFNIKERPWYKKALTSNKLISTPLYQFNHHKNLGFSYAIKLNDNHSVFAIDYTLKSLHKVLKNQKILQDSEIFLFNKEGVLFASSEDQNKNTLGTLDAKLFHFVKAHNENKILKYTCNEKYYYVIYKKINKNLYLGIRLNADLLLAPYIKNIIYSFSFALLLILLSIPLILYATTIIAKPINALIYENEKIKNREFGSIKPIDTNIIEFQELSDSLIKMANSIKAHQGEQKRLLNSIVELIAKAVDAKSTYTAGHCRRVPEIANMLLDAANKSTTDKLKNFQMYTNEEKEAFNMAAWLHDCGKVTTPEYVVDKATKLETIYNRIHEIRTRFEILWRDAQINYLKSLLAGADQTNAYATMQKEQKTLLDDFKFIAEANIGKEFMSIEDQQRVKQIANRTWIRNFDDTLGLSQEELQRKENKNITLPAKEYLLRDKQEHIIKRENFNYELYLQEGFKEEVPQDLYNYGEIYNLCIQKGTLTQEERYKINEHVIMSIKMLEDIPFPPELKKVPEYAGEHHEKLDGKGYPRQLTVKDLSIASRIMAIADIFEALTAADRPYKEAKTLSRALDIMYYMTKEQHIDKELFQLFVKEKIYLTYAKQYLKAEQIDKVDEEKYFN